MIHALYLYGGVARWQQVLIVLVVWTIQLLLTSVWMRKYRFGPALT